MFTKEIKKIPTKLVVHILSLEINYRIIYSHVISDPLINLVSISSALLTWWQRLFQGPIAEKNGDVQEILPNHLKDPLFRERILVISLKKIENDLRGVSKKKLKRLF